MNNIHEQYTCSTYTLEFCQVKEFDMQFCCLSAGWKATRSEIVFGKCIRKGEFGGEN